MELIRDTVLQVAISKLCAMFQIGPEVQKGIPYDLNLCGNAKFHLELAKQQGS